LHVVIDNYAAHKHPAVTAWLGRHPRITLHFTPDLRVLAEPRRGVLRDPHPPGHPPRTFTSVADLETAIGNYIDGWNERCQPFTWTKDADTILARATPPKNRKTHVTSETRH
jgi:hypothetical protein